MALRDALVIDKWRRVAPPDKRRRRAAARLLYFIRFAVSPNINLTQIYKTKPYNKNFPYGSGAAPLNRFRPAPLSPARNVFFLPYILFRMCGFLLLRFTAVSCRLNTVSPVVASDFVGSYVVFPDFKSFLFSSRYVIVSLSSRTMRFFVGMSCVRLRFVGISGHVVVILVTKSVLHFSCVCGIVHSSVKGRSENFVKIPPDMSKNLCFYG